MTEQSPQGALAAALAKAQAAMTVAHEDSQNPHFRSTFASLASVISAVRPHLAANGIAYTQAASLDEGGYVVVVTTLRHEGGGEVDDGGLRAKPRKDDPQSVGSAITYLRRYGLMAMCGIAPGDDDDGNAASTDEPPGSPRGGASTPPRSTGSGAGDSSEYAAGASGRAAYMASIDELGVSHGAVKRYCAAGGAPLPRARNAEQLNSLLSHIAQHLGDVRKHEEAPDA